MWNAERLLSRFYRSSSGSDDNWLARPAKKSRPVLTVPRSVQGLQASPVPIPQFNFASPDTSTTSFVDKRNTIWDEFISILQDKRYMIQDTVIVYVIESKRVRTNRKAGRKQSRRKYM